MKVKLSFGHKAVISSLSKLNIKSEILLFKSLSVWYAILECYIKSESLAVICSYSIHFVTFWTKLQIIKFLLKKLFILVCYLRISHKKWQDLVFSVKLHLGLIPWHLTLDPYPLSQTLVPYPLVEFLMKNLCEGNCDCHCHCSSHCSCCYCYPRWK